MASLTVRRLSPFVLTPALLVLAPLIHIYADVPGHWTIMVRPAVIAMLVVMALTAGLATLTNRLLLSSAVVSLAILLFFEWRLGITYLFIAVVVLASRRWIFHRSGQLRAAVLGVPVILFLAATLTHALASGAITVDDFSLALSRPSPTSASSELPNVYVLLLDGYPRQDTLRTEFNHDNEPFLDDLERLGFSVNREARTAFANTEMTLASTQTDDPAALLAAAQAAGSQPGHIRREVRRSRLVNTEVMEGFRDLGYRLEYIPPPVTFVDWTGWDERHAMPHPNDYETIIIQSTPLSLVLGEWVMDQARDRVDDTLELWVAGSGQRVAFAHLVPPHPPFLWGDEGEELMPPPCWSRMECNLYNGRPIDLDLSLAEYAEAVGFQVDELNDRVTDAITRALASDPEAIIVVFSDHGSRYEGSESGEAHRSLFAVRGIDVDSADALFVNLLAELAARTAGDG